MSGYSLSAVASSFGEGIAEGFRFPFFLLGSWLLLCAAAAFTSMDSLFLRGGSGLLLWVEMDDSGVNGSINVWGVDCAVRYITRKFLLYDGFR